MYNIMKLIIRICHKNLNNLIHYVVRYCYCIACIALLISYTHTNASSNKPDHNIPDHNITKDLSKTPHKETEIYKQTITYNNNKYHIEIHGIHNIDPKQIVHCLKFSTYHLIDVKKSIKGIIDTGMVHSVQIEQDTGRVIIRIVENPIVEKITFSGIKKENLNKINENIGGHEITSGSFTNAEYLNDFCKAITEYFQNKGYFQAKTLLKIEKTYNNKINVHIKIDKGTKVRIKNIKFFGNKHIASTSLAQNIRASKTQFYHLVTDIVVNNSSMENEALAIENLYYSYGFLDAKVTDVKAILSKDRKFFILNFHIFEGQKYFVSTIDLSIDIQDNPKQQKEIQKIFQNIVSSIKEESKYKNKIVFSYKKIQFITETIKARIKNFGSFYVTYKSTIDAASKTVSLTYCISNVPVFHVSSIEITGNQSIPENFIRKQINISEGNRYFEINPYEIENTILSSGFFEEVKVNIVELSSDKNKTKNIKILIQTKEKQSTPNIKLFAGYSQLDGLFCDISMGVKRYNFNTNISFRFATMMKILQFQIDNNPDAQDMLYDFKFYLMSDSRKSKGNKNAIVKDTIDPLSTDQDYDSFFRNTIGTSLYVSFPINEFIQYGPEIGISYQDVRANNKMSKMFIKQSGKYLITTLGHQIQFMSLDNHRLPKDGYSISIKNSFSMLSVISGQFPAANFMRNIVNLKYYKSFNKSKSIYSSSTIEAGAINTLNDKKQLRILDKFFVNDIPHVKGMHPIDGCGPKNQYGKNYESVGGSKFLSASFNLHMPFTKKLTKAGINWFAFVSALAIFDTNLPNRINKISQNSIDFNITAGVGLSLFIGFGSMMIYFAYPVKMHKKDVPMYIGFSSE